MDDNTIYFMLFPACSFLYTMQELHFSYNKWKSNTDYICCKLRQRFYAVSCFKHFRPNKQQRDHFIQSRIKPILLYNLSSGIIILLINRRKTLTKRFSQNSFDIDMDFSLKSCVCKTAANVIAYSSHVLHSCYQTNQKHHQAPKANTNQFLDSFVPLSIRPTELLSFFFHFFI